MAGWNEWVTGANMTLSEVLDALKSATIGLDVKDKLFWSYYKIVELAIKEGNANFDVAKAAGRFKDLASRLDASDQKLDSNTAQLAHIDGKKIDKNRGAVTSSDLSQEVKEQMTGGSVAVVGENAVNTENIIDGAVTGDKTDFLTKNENLLNLDAVRTGGYYGQNGNWATNELYNAFVIDIPHGGEYITNIGVLGNIHSEVCYWDDSGNVVPSNIPSGGWSGTLDIPQNVRKVSFAYHTSLNISGVMFVVGTVLPEKFIPYGYYINTDASIPQSSISGDKIGDSTITGDKIADNTIGGSKLDFMTETENLINLDAVRTGGYYGQNGNWATNELYNAFVIDIPHGGEYITNIGVISTFYSEVCYWDENGNVVPSSISAGQWSGTLNIPQNVRKVSFAYPTSFDISGVMFVAGTTLPSRYIPNGFYLDDNIILKDSNSDSSDRDLSDLNLLSFGDSLFENATMDEDGSNYRLVASRTVMNHIPSFTGISKIKNYARSGATVKNQNNTSDRRLSVSEQINMSIANGEQADIILFHAGTNDTGSTSIGSYETAINKESLDDLNMGVFYEALRWELWTIKENYPEATCFISTPLQRASKEQPEWVSVAIKEMGKRYNFIVVDSMNESGIVREFEVLSGNGRYLADGLHTNEDGMKIWAKLWSRSIRSAYDY